MALLKGWKSLVFSGQALRHGFSFVQTRAMSRLFVGGLAYSTDEESLRKAFEAHGEVIDCRVITDRETNRSKGFGFVTFLEDAQADIARQKMNSQFLDGRVIRVDKATPRPPPPPPPPPLDLPPAPDSVQSPSEDWGSIPSPIASVPQNAGMAYASSTPGAAPPNPSSDLPDLNSIASGGTTPVNSFPDIGSLTSPSSSSSINPPTAPYSSTPSYASSSSTGSSFDFSNLGLSSSATSDMPRRRPPRIRPSMMSDYEFGYHMSNSAKFPYNSNFDTGVPRPKGPEFEFEFPEFGELKF